MMTMTMMSMIYFPNERDLIVWRVAKNKLPEYHTQLTKIASLKMLFSERLGIDPTNFKDEHVLSFVIEAVGNYYTAVDGLNHAQLLLNLLKPMRTDDVLLVNDAWDYKSATTKLILSCLNILMMAPCFEGSGRVIVDLPDWDNWSI